MSDLLDTAIAAHGGLDLWRGLDALRFRVRVRGPILLLRGRSPRLRSMTATLGAHRVFARLDPLLPDGSAGVLDGDEVRIESPRGEVLARRERPPNGAHAGLRWDALDEAYFLTYALWNYATAPFLLALPGVETREIEPDGDVRRLAAVFPPTIPTHCREQTFHFGPDGVLRRLDYVAEVFGEIAHAAHFTNDPETFDGLVVPTHRRVVHHSMRRFPRAAPPAMEGWIDRVELVRRAD